MKREDSQNENVYGFCPQCGSPGVIRERRPNGNDRCENDHVYPSRTATQTPVYPVEVRSEEA